MEKNKDDENEDNIANPRAPVANISRQVACWRCEKQDHAVRNRNCPVSVTEVHPIAPIVALQSGGRIRLASERRGFGQSSCGLTTSSGHISIVGSSAAYWGRYLEELAEIDQEPPPPTVEIRWNGL